MGIFDLLQHLPGGAKNDYHHSFYELGVEHGLKGGTVPLDAASVLWQLAARHARDYIDGNYTPALCEWARWLNIIRSICQWKLLIIMDGRENVDKAPEIARRKERVEAAKAKDNLSGQIHNTPKYITLALNVCKQMSIDVMVAAYEADPQVSYESMKRNLVPVTADSDEIAYGISTKVVIVQGFLYQWYRIIDLEADVEEGKYPLFDLYKRHGRIVFQLYAGCSGCDFTEVRSGITGIGIKKFILAANNIDGELNAKSLAISLWNNDNDIVINDGFELVDEVEDYLQRIVNVYVNAKVYDKDGNIINITTSEVIKNADDNTRRHKDGLVNSRTEEELSTEFLDEIKRIKSLALTQQTPTQSSNICGVNLPSDKPLEQCSCGQLRDYIAARGGSIKGNKDELVSIARSHLFLDKQVQRKYVDRNPDPNGMLYLKVDTSSIRPIDAILRDLVNTQAVQHSNQKDLIELTYRLYNEGHFEDQYDNISLIAPELQEGFIYQMFGHIGSSIKEKNIGDALRRCWYDNGTSYHGIAFVPETNRVIILSKAHASMTKDEKTRGKTAEGESPLKQEYIVIMELIYKETSDMEDKHSLGIFVDIGRHFCGGGCVAGQGCCRHITERLWFQFHHWTKERLGIERPSTLDVCSWHKGGTALNCDVRQKIYEQQTVKHERSIEEQKAKMERNVQRDCTKGSDCSYQPHVGKRKQANVHPGRFTKARSAPLFKLIEEQSGSTKK